MSLIGDLAAVYEAEAGLADAEAYLADYAVDPMGAPRAAKKTSTDDTDPPIPYVMPGAGSMAMWGTGTSLTSQLQLSVAESTLFSALELIAKKTSAAPWTWHRKTRTRNPDQEPPEITGEQNHAVHLWNKPNNFMTGKQVRQIGTWHLRSVGKAWFVVDFYDAAQTLPRAWWPVRPDRMAPTLDAGKFLTGYTYTGPDGQKIDLDQREVLRLVNPHPIDVWDGIGVVQVLAKIVGTSLTTEQWVDQFFRNDASPGGFISYPAEFEDADYERQRRRWNEQHQGVSKAHRIGIIEMAGTYHPRGFSIKDLQFPEIRHLTRDQILEAFRIHKHNMGISEDVNRASAEAALTQLAENELEPNLEDWSELANGPYAALFGAVGESVLACYKSPKPEDHERDRLDGTAKVQSYVALVNARVQPKAASDFLGLPELPLVLELPPAEGDGGSSGTVASSKPDAAAGDLDETAKGDPLAVATVAQKVYLAVEGGPPLKRVEGRQLLKDAGAKIDPNAPPDAEDEPAKETPAVPVPPVVPEETEPGTSEQDTGDDEASTGDGPAAAVGEGTPSGQLVPGPAGPTAPLINLQAVAEMAEQERPRAGPADDVDLSTMDDEWQAALAAVLAKWPNILEEQYSSLARQVRDAIDDNDLDALLALSTPDGGAEDTLTLAMVAAALIGANAVVREADEQGVQIGAKVPTKTELGEQAKVITGLMRQGLAIAAATAALRVLAPDASGEDVAEQVRTHLDSLTEAEPKRHLGGAMTTAQNAGRFETLTVAPQAAYYSSEQLDKNTCGPCRTVDGRRYDTIEASKEDYPTSGYRKCEGLERCRGTVVAVWSHGEEDDE
jgi:HK97 family phage portal protein